MKLSILVAMAANRVIGRGGELPWRLSADLQRFKRLTMGHAIIMGRKTYESIGRALPGRRSIVITRQADFRPSGVETVSSLAAALRLATHDEEAFVIGGGQVYALALPLADRLYLTAVEAEIPGDTLFPEVAADQWRLVEESFQPADEKNSFASWFRVLDRDKPPSTKPMLNKESRMSLTTETELLNLSMQLLDAIGEKDWDAYVKLCDVSLTCFEPEALGQLVEGLEFHKFYFDLEGVPGKRNTTLASPHVRLMGADAAVVSYVRLIQKLDGSGQPVTVSIEETRVWQRINGSWRHVHFHRSPIAAK